MKWMEGIGPGDVIYVFVSTGRGVGMLYGPFEAEGTAALRITDRLPPSFPAHIRFKQPTRLEVNHIYTCFPPGPLTRSAITTAIESARARGPSPSPSPSPSPRRVFWRDASTRPLRESNRSPAPAIVTPQKSPRRSPSSRRVQVRAELYRGLANAILPLPPQSLIIWDEAPMTHRHCYEAVDRTLRFIMGRRPAHPLPARLPAGG